MVGKNAETLRRLKQKQQDKNEVFSSIKYSMNVTGFMVTERYMPSSTHVVSTLRIRQTEMRMDISAWSL
ncbi:MAG: hypothetical protein ACRC2T_16665 [Thermoguttaceae bacterium]